MTDQPSDQTQPTPRVGPDHRDLYLIIVGIVLGVLLGPAVLGRLSPTTYAELFRGGTAVEQEIAAYEQDLATTRQRLIDSGVTDVAVEEFDLRPREEGIVLQARLQKAKRDHRAKLVGRNVAIVLAVLAMMLVETLVDPSQLSIRSRLATARYALLAVWLALMLAAPTMFGGVPMFFLAGLIAMALLTALVPLRRAAAKPRRS